MFSNGHKRQGSAFTTGSSSKFSGGGFDRESLQSTLGQNSLLPLPANIKEVIARRGYNVSHCSIRYGYAESQGLRLTMEDTISIVPKIKHPDTFYCGVFDGHGGDLVSNRLRQVFHKQIQKNKYFSSNDLAK